MEGTGKERKALFPVSFPSEFLPFLSKHISRSHAWGADQVFAMRDGPRGDYVPPNCFSDWSLDLHGWLHPWRGAWCCGIHWWCPGSIGGNQAHGEAGTIPFHHQCRTPWHSPHLGPPLLMDKLDPHIHRLGFTGSPQSALLGLLEQIMFSGHQGLPTGADSLGAGPWHPLPLGPRSCWHHRQRVCKCFGQCSGCLHISMPRDLGSWLIHCWAQALELAWRMRNFVGAHISHCRLGSREGLDHSFKSLVAWGHAFPVHGCSGGAVP